MQRRWYEEALTLGTQHDLWWPTALASTNAGTLAELEGRHREAFKRHERSVAIAEAAGDRWMRASCILNLGRAASHAGDIQRAIALYGEAVRAFVQLDNAWGVAVCLDGFAYLVDERGDFLGAARLYGAEEPIRDRAGTIRWPAIRSEHDAGVGAASTALGEAAWAGADSEGAALTEEAAVGRAPEVGAAEGSARRRVAQDHEDEDHELARAPSSCSVHASRASRSC